MDAGLGMRVVEAAVGGGQVAGWLGGDGMWYGVRLHNIQICSLHQD
jgi:hypothetical protein